MEKLTDDEMKAKTTEFRNRLQKGETLDDLLPEAFALVREATRRTLGTEHYPCQLQGGIILHQGRIAEMKTGEGKTPVSYTHLETLLKVGNEKAEVSHSDNPICFSDVYFRVGGANYKGKVKNCVTINSNDVIGDNFWVWRADHGDNVGWDMNTAPNGIVINGDNVTTVSYTHL